ncbi:MAG: S9 family peptidase [Deltaproteobacteria bacterium]|jgi:dipeptidyl aminopeptidase/acylaminoacyl peptidase|nr:S9 family peptidase [Deltaproteobacteria bacterium]
MKLMTKPVPIDFFAKLTYLKKLSLSGAGEAAFLATTVSSDVDGYRSDLWLYSDVEGLRKLTFPWSIEDFCWTDDKKALVRTLMRKEMRQERQKQQEQEQWQWQEQEQEHQEEQQHEHEHENEHEQELKRQEPNSEPGKGPASLYWSIETDSGRYEKMFSLPFQAENLTKLADGSYVFEALSSPNDDRQASANGDVWEAERIPFWSDAVGTAAQMRRSLFKYHSGRIVRLTPPELEVETWRLDAGNIDTGKMDVGSVDAGKMEAGKMDAWKIDAGKVDAGKIDAGKIEAGKIDSGRLLFIAKSVTDVKLTANHVYILDLADGAIRKLTKSAGHIHHLAVRQGERYIIAVNDAKLHGIYQDPAIELIDSAGRKLARLNASAELRPFNSLASDILLDAPSKVDLIVDGRSFFFIATIDDHCPVMKGNFREGSLREGDFREGSFREGDFRVGDFRPGDFGMVENLVGDVGDAPLKPLTPPDFSATEIKINSGLIYCLGFRGQNALELYRFRQGGGEVEQITHFNDKLTADVAPSDVAPSGPLCLTTPKSIKGWLLKPYGFEAGKRYPAIISIHGGPDMTYGPFFIHELRFLASSGFAVMYCNPRGSSGRGGAFADIRERYGEADVESIFEFLDEALKSAPWIDPQRLGIMGGSYGGYLTALIIGKTDRFKAAVAERFESNLISQFLLSEIGCEWIYDTFHADPWSNPEKLWNASPLKYANQVKTPTLVLHGAKDHTCEISGAMQFFAALKYNGRKARLVVFEEARHGFKITGKPSWRVRRLKEIADWFSAYLKAESDEQ